MPSFNLRPATQDDASSIKALIHAVKINPIGLNWQRFIVATTPDAGLIGCGQVKLHGDGSRELASIAVVEQWRGRGAARAMIEYLLAAHPAPLYLTCIDSLGPFYARFGFQETPFGEMPPYFQRIYRLFGAFRGLKLTPKTLLVMHKDSQ